MPMPGTHATRKHARYNYDGTTPRVADFRLGYGYGHDYPSQSDILDTEVTTAIRVAEFMFDQGLAQVEHPRDIRTWIESQLYRAQY